MGLHQNIHREPIAELSVRRAVTATADTTVRDACRLMRDQHLGAVVVVDGVGRAIGMFNEKLLIRLLVDRPDAFDRPVGESMTTNLACLRRDQPIIELINTMRHRKLRWVCLVDDEHRPVGLTGLRGVMEYVVEHFPRAVKVEPITASIAIKQREGA